MSSKLASARQLGTSGLFGRLVWRIRWCARILCFYCLHRHTGWRSFARHGWQAGKPLAPHFLPRLEALTRALDGGSRLAPGERQRIIGQAEQAFAGELEIRGHGGVALRLTPSNWYDYRDAELRLMVNRHDFLIPLCQAAMLTEDPRYRERIRTLFEYWCAHFSPAMLIAHDTPIDAAIRLLNWTWVFSLRVLDLDPTTNTALKRMLHLQLEYIRAWSSAGGNHLVLEALASFVYGVLFRPETCARRWRRWGERTLSAEILRQVSPDGVHTEQSMFYHQVVTTHFLKAYLTAQRNSLDLAPAFGERLRRMIRFVHDTTRPDLGHPVLGDGEPLTSADREHWEANVLPAAGAVLFDDPIYAPYLLACNDATLWFLAASAQTLPTTPLPPKSKLFADSGIAVLRGETRYLLMDAAPFGDRHFPHHGHADALSVEIAMNGQTLVVDPGGYGYYNDPFRQYFRSTRAHNTVRLNGRDQSDVFGVLGYGRLAPVSLEDWDLGGTLEHVRASHTGYRPLGHRREIYHGAGASGFFLIVDWLWGPKDCEAEVLYHLAPGVDVDLDHRTLLTESDEFVWDFVTDAPLRATRVYGAENGEIQGWYAPATRERVPIAVLQLRGPVSPPAFIATAIFAKDVQGRLVRVEEGVALETQTDRLVLRADFAAARSSSATS